MGKGPTFFFGIRANFEQRVPITGSMGTRRVRVTAKMRERGGALPILREIWHKQPLERGFDAGQGYNMNIAGALTTALLEGKVEMVGDRRFWKVLWLLGLLPLAGFAAEDEVVTFSLADADIQAIAEQEGAIWVQLDPPAAARLHNLTKQSYGKRLEVDVDGIPILRVQVHATVESGVIQIPEPSPEVRRGLERLKTHGSKRW